jgi:hypothetical protein
MEKLAVLNSRAPQVSDSRGQAELLRGLRRPNRCRGKPPLRLSGKQGVRNLIKTEQIMGGARNELGDRRSRGQLEQPDADQLEPAAYGPGLGQKPEHHQAEANVVRFSEDVQSGQRIGEAQQADGACEKEERARRDGASRIEGAPRNICAGDERTGTRNAGQVEREPRPTRWTDRVETVASSSRSLQRPPRAPPEGRPDKNRRAPARESAAPPLAPAHETSNHWARRRDCS